MRKETAGGPREKQAFLVCGTHSGCGKTTITLGLLAALRARGLSVQPFKVGPDFIDPGLHTQIAGKQSRNLDGWMLSRRWNEELFRRLLEGSDVGLIEGVMGLFDGYEGQTESGSSAEMAKWLEVPAVLVVDARSMARSAAALIYGFTRFDPALNFAGVIFNRIGGEAHLEYLKEAVASACPEVAVLGGIPEEDAGPNTREAPGACNRRRNEAGRRVAEDIGRAYGKAPRHRPAPGKDPISRCGIRNPPAPLWKGGELSRVRPPCPLWRNRRRAARQTGGGSRPVIAVARDAAFCFYYPDNLELLEKAGARLRFFSPVRGETLPEECSGAYLGGGYPELFAEAISGECRFSSISSRARRAEDADLCRMRRPDDPWPLYRHD